MKGFAVVAALCLAVVVGFFYFAPNKNGVSFDVGVTKHTSK